MAFKLADRVRQVSTTAGLADLVLGTVVPTFRLFSAAYADGDTLYYAAVNRDVVGEWEVGYGTWVTATGTLQRTTILSSSNANAKVNFSAGTKDVTITYPAAKAVVHDTNGDVAITRNISLATNNSAIQGTRSSGTVVNLVRLTNDTNNLTRFIAGVDAGGFQWTNQAESTAWMSLSSARLTVLGGITTGESLLASSDNSYDIGVNGANRYRDLWLSRNATIGGTLLANQLISQSTSGALVYLNTTGGAISDVAYVQMARGGANKWWAGNNVAGTNVDEYHISSGTAGAGSPLLAITQAGQFRFAGRLTITGDASGSSALVIGTSTVGTSNRVDITNGTDTMRFEVSSGRAFVSAPSSSNVELGTAGVTHFQIDWANGFTHTKDFQAITDNTYDIGSFSKRFRDITMSRHVIAGGYLQFTATPASNPNASVGRNAAAGLMIVGVTGTSYDVMLLAPSGASIFKVPTGTDNLTIDAGTVTLAGNNMLPASSGITDIGGAATLFRHAYFTGNAEFGGTSMSIGSAGKIGFYDRGSSVFMGVIGSSYQDNGNYGVMLRSMVSSGAETNRWQLAHAGHWLAYADNTYDIGASGANRPRDFFLARNANIGGTVQLSGADFAKRDASGTIPVHIIRPSVYTVVANNASATFAILSMSYGKIIIVTGNGHYAEFLFLGYGNNLVQLSNTNASGGTPFSFNTTNTAGKINVYGSGGTTMNINNLSGSSDQFSILYFGQ